MGIIQNIVGKREEIAPVTDSIYVGKSVEEAMKGLVVDEINKTKIDTSDLGVEHPFDFTVTEGLYRKFGFIMGVVDKFIDFVVGPGYTFKVINEQGENIDRAEVIITDFLYHTDFETLLRAWLKEALLKGNGFMELAYGKDNNIDGMKVLNANRMFVKRKDTSEIIEYNQFKGGLKNKIALSKDDKITFSPDEIAHLKLNVVGDDAYGLGIIFPAMNTINNLIMCDTDMHMLMNRKANAPIHAKIGSLEHKRIPSDAVVTGFGQKLEWLHNKHEWVTGPDIDMKVLDFGNIGEKFSYPLEFDTKMLFYTFQVPEVLMGNGSIPEGLAKVQMEAFMMRIQSIQAEIEKILEKQIIKRVLISNGFDFDVEMEWNSSNKDERNAEVNLLSGLVGKFGSALNTLIEQKIVTTLGFDQDEYDMLKDKEEKEKEQMRADTFAQQGLEAPKTDKEDNNKEREEEDQEELPKLPLKRKESVYTKEQCECCKKEMLEDKDYELHEWLGFNYQNIKSYIVNAIARDAFKDLKADNKEEYQQGYLSKKQVTKLRETMIEAFDTGKSVNWTTKTLKERGIIGPLMQEDEDGQMIEKLSADLRAYIVSRTESTRLANKGNLDYYKTRGFNECRWISASSERTCEECNAMNGKIMSLSEAENQIPLHVNCRCTTAPITELD